MSQPSAEQILLSILQKNPVTADDFFRFKNATCNTLHIAQPANRLLREAYQNLLKKKRIARNSSVEQGLKKATVRTTSGIAVITSLVKPFMCPGKCVYCPTEIRMPKSYVASEPAAARSLRLNFNPYLLMQKRIEMLEKNGHPCDKIEYITKGGTWNAYPLKYQYWFIMESFKACNNFIRRHPLPSTSEHDWDAVPLADIIAETEKEQTYNEHARHRIIGITLETRPDAISAKTIAHMRSQGCTRVELGLQAPDDRILDLIKRGHTVQQFKNAMYLLRTAGFKVDLHFMPDLPGTTPEHDVEMYQALFSDPDFRPDMMKIYPNAVIQSAELYQWFFDGRYQSYGNRALIESLKQMKLSTPRYCRISRLIRDIPATKIEHGNTTTNLREVLSAELKKEGKCCVCLRCREIGRIIKIQKHKNIKKYPPILFTDQYETRGGTEYFLTFEDPDRIAVYGFLRLRIPTTPAPPSPTRGEIYALLPETKDAAFIRELHVYGQLVKIGTQESGATQHRGLGKRLVEEAEKIARKNGFLKVAVISGVGVRGYYRKLGYRKAGTYMVKRFLACY